MNILVFSWRDPKHPLAGGAEQVMHQHMKGWLRAGHRVTLFASKMPNLPTEEEIEGIRVVRRGNQYYLGVQLQGFFYYLQHGKEYDLIIDQFHGMPFFTPIYCRQKKLAVIQETAREVWFLNPFHWPINWLIGSVGYLLEPIVFQFYRGVQFMTGSESAKDALAKMGISPKKITVVPHGVMLDLPKKMPPKASHKTVTFLGVLSKDKGIFDVLECFKLLSDDSSFQFWVIGRAETKELEKRIVKRIRELRLSRKVKMWGYVSQSRKFELLAKSHLLINPSRREGWGLVNIEANAVGTPVVAYRNLGLVDSVKDGFSGVLVNNKTPKSLVLSVKELLSDKKRYAKLSERSRRWSQKFSCRRSQSTSLALIAQFL